MIVASLNMQAWQKAAKDLFGFQTKRNLQDFVNGQSFALVMTAMKQTKKADYDAIARALEKVKYAEYALFKKTKDKSKIGKINWREVRKTYDESSLVIRLLAKRMRDTGDWGVKGSAPTDDIQDVARKFVGRRRSSAGFIKSGWIPAVKELWGKLYTKPKTSDSMAGGKIMGVPKGGALAAVFQWNRPVNATAWNTALIVSKEGRSSNPEPVAMAGLDAAFGIHAADMANRLKLLMEKEFRRTANG